jgi:hypothetical protein
MAWITQDLKVFYAVVTTIGQLYYMIYFVAYLATIVTCLTIHLEGLGSKALSLSSVAP